MKLSCDSKLINTLCRGSQMGIRVQEILEQIKHLSIKTFGGNLSGVYVHGSLALECFSWDNSDIDFVVVLGNAPTQTQKEEYISGLLNINKNCPPKGLEMSIVLERYTRQFVYPTPFELHFSNAHLKQCSENIREYCQKMNGTDKDLAAHFTIINKACITVCGKAAKDTFGEVPKNDYFNSIKCDIENAEKDIIENPTYTILNLCRVLAYKYDGLILSKKDGGNWGIAHIDAQYVGIIGKARNIYQGSASNYLEVNDDFLIAFAKYMHNLIFAE